MPELSKTTQQSLYKAVDQSVKEAASACGTDHAKKGGYFRLYMLPVGGLYYDLVSMESVWVGGSANKDKRPKYEIISLEKAIRLVQHIDHFNHKTSWESRNDQKGLYGGAVFLDCEVEEFFPTFGRRQVSQLVFSFSGLPEVGDETAMLMTARRIKEWRVSNDQISQILIRSKNHLARRLLQPLSV